MSMISEQVHYLRSLAADRTPEALYEVFDALNEAADTIEALSAKLAKANMDRSEAYYGGGWIPCSDRLPEDKKVEIYDMQLVTLDNGDVCLGVYRHDDKEWLTRMSEGESVYSNNHNVMAWQPLPEPYKPQ